MRNVITRYPMRSLKKSTEKRVPTITYWGMIPGEEPPYRPLLTEQIDIEQGLYIQELGQVSAGLVNVEDALEDWLVLPKMHLYFPNIMALTLSTASIVPAITKSSTHREFKFKVP